MGIALGYAFLLAIAGGMIAICFAWLGELMEDRAADAPRGESFPAPRQATPQRRLGARQAGGLHHQF